MTKGRQFAALIALCAVAGSIRPAVAQYESEVISSGVDLPEFTVMGFGDVSYISRDGTDQDGFFIGKDSEYSIEVERMIVKYDFNDLLKISAGRYHTPIGYWNSAFHHGAWLQTTTSRPEMARFGSSIVPIHFVGLLAEGKWNRSKLGLSYQAGFGNGRHANIARAGDAGDINGDKAWMFQLKAAPEALRGLNLGIGYYTDEVSPEIDPPVNESTISAYAAWTRESPEVIVEILHSTHDLVSDSSIKGDVNAWYAQFAYRLKGDLNKWKPYARIEHTDVDDSDPLLGGILGVRWDFNTYGALKAEYRNEEYDNAGKENNFRVQVSFVLANL